MQTRELEKVQSGLWMDCFAFNTRLSSFVIGYSRSRPIEDIEVMDFKFSIE